MPNLNLVLLNIGYIKTVSPKLKKGLIANGRKKLCPNFDRLTDPIDAMPAPTRAPMS